MEYKTSKATLWLICFSLLFWYPVPHARAETLPELLKEILRTHERIEGAQQDLQAARHGVTQARAGWFPTLSLTGTAGHEQQNKPSAANTSTPFHEIKLSATQLVYDFGKTSAGLRTSHVTVARSRTRLRRTRQALILEGTGAYLNLLRTADTLRFARQSEARVKDVRKMEDAKVKRGAGLASDVLQAKAQFAGASAIRVRAAGGFVISRNRYISVFEKPPGALKSYRRPKLPLARLPKKVDDAIAVARKNNLDLASSQFDVDIAGQNTRSARSTFFPKIEIKGDYKRLRNVAGTIGAKTEKVIKLELTYPLFTGGKDTAAYRASVNRKASALKRRDDLRRSVDEQVRNAWQNMITAKANAEFLRNQANISGEFFDIARREVRLGRRALLDVLNAETNFINSVSAAVSAETDYALAVYNLLFAMGELDLDVFAAK